MKIIYMINAKCNTHCFHCYRGNATEKNIGQCKEEIELLTKQGHQIIIAGAEVLCEPEKLTLYELVNQNYLLSNGIVFATNPGIVNKIKKHGISKIVLSWHIEFPELIKSIPEKKTLQAIKTLRKEGVTLSVNCVIGNRNFNQLEKITKQLIEIGVGEVKFFQLLPTNEKVIPYLLNETQKDFFFRQVSVLRNRYPKDVLCLRLHANFNSTLTRKAKLAKQEGNYCPAGKDLIVIESDNKIYPCPYMANHKFYIGKLREGELVFEKTIANNGRDCYIETVFRNECANEKERIER